MQHPKKLIGLDVLRGLACLTVWVSHVRITTGYFNAPKYDFVQIFMSWGREAVVVFFILSGIVINLASHNRTDRWQYFKKRFLRIYPIFLVILIICYTADYFVYRNPFDFGYIIGTLLLQGMTPSYIVRTMPIDAATWTITCEAFFYVVFGLLYKTNRRRSVWIWLGLSVASIIFTLFHEFRTGVLYQFLNLLNNSFLWLLGYLIYDYREKLRSNAATAVCGLLMIPLITRLNGLPDSFRAACYYLAGLYLLPLFIFILGKYTTRKSEGSRFTIHHIYFLAVYLINVWALWHYSNSLPISKLLYSVIPLASILFYSGFVKTMLKRIYNAAKRLLLFFADISYPLYLVHTPTMYLVYHFLPGQKLLGMVLIVVIAISASYLLEVYLFRKLIASVNHQTARKQLAEETII